MQIAIGSAGTWAPIMGSPRNVQVQLGLGSQAPSQADAGVIGVKVQAAGVRCARSYRADRGTALGTPSAGSQRGELYATTLQQISFSTSAPVRVCAWPSAAPRAFRVLSKVIQIYGADLLGAAAIGDGSLNSVAQPYSTVIDQLSTYPATEHLQVSESGDDSCENRDETHVAVAGVGGLYESGTSDGPRLDDAGGRPCMHATTDTWSETGLPSYQLMLPDSFWAPIGQMQPQDAGNACNLESVPFGLSVTEAAAAVKAAGCTVSQVLSDRYQGGSSVEHGGVGAVTLEGEHVLLVPKGTAVTLVTNGNPDDLLTQLIDRYGGPAGPGETVKSSYDSGAHLPAGAILLRFFIPGSRAAGGLLKGDDRDYSSDINARYRAALLLDTVSGQVAFRVSPSCRKGIRGFLFSRDGCRGALPLSLVPREDVWKHSDRRRASNLFSVTDEGDGALHIRLSILNSYTNTLPGALGAWSVDEDLSIANTPSGPQLSLVGNGYPAIEAYYFPADGSIPVETIALRDVEHPLVAAHHHQLDGGGGDAALDRASWATCSTEPSGTTMTCTDKHENGRTWSTSWPAAHT